MKTAFANGKVYVIEYAFYKAEIKEVNNPKVLHCSGSWDAVHTADTPINYWGLRTKEVEWYKLYVLNKQTDKWELIEKSMNAPDSINQ